MKLGSFALTAAAFAAALFLGTAPTAAQAQAAEQFVPLLVYRTGQFAPLGIPWADGKQDYLKLVNARDGENSACAKIGTPLSRPMPLGVGPSRRRRNRWSRNATPTPTSHASLSS